MSAVTIIPAGSESEEAYRSSGAWGSTLVSTFLRSPMLAHLLHTRAHVQPTTPAMRLGTAFHHRCDPGFDFDKTYRVGPDADRRAKAWKEAEALAQLEGTTLLTAEEHGQITAMRASVLANPIATALLDRAEHEVGFRMTAPGGSFQLQCRADILHRWDHLADLKTVATLDDFPRSVITHGYHRQAALYRFIVHAACGAWLPFSFIAVEKEAPLYRCRVFDLSPAFLELGMREVEAALVEIGRRTESGDWGDHRDAESIDAPRWLIDQVEARAA